MPIGTSSNAYVRSGIQLESVSRSRLRTRSRFRRGDLYGKWIVHWINSLLFLRNSSWLHSAKQCDQSVRDCSYIGLVEDRNRSCRGWRLDLILLRAGFRDNERSDRGRKKFADNNASIGILITLMRYSGSQKCLASNRVPKYANFSICECSKVSWRDIIYFIV